jgi:hypothetical protein
VNFNEAEEIDLGMSNFDHSIDDGFEEALKEKPKAVYGRHSGWNFNGLVYFEGGMFFEQVWRYGAPVATISAPSLLELMEIVNSEYGDT